MEYHLVTTYLSTSTLVTKPSHQTAHHALQYDAICMALDGLVLLMVIVQTQSLDCPPHVLLKPLHW